MVDALGNPLAFFLTARQAHDLQRADALLPQMQADTLLADKAFNADERVIEPLLAAGKMPVIPPKSNRKCPRPYDKEIYKARRPWETPTASSNSTEPLRPAMTRPPETSSPASIWPPLSSGLIEDRP
jgi:transposase